MKLLSWIVQLTFHSLDLLCDCVSLGQKINLSRKSWLEIPHQKRLFVKGM